MDYTLIIHSLLIGWWLANFIPLQNLLTKHVKPRVKNQYLRNGLSCHKCLSFWTCIILALPDFLPFEAIACAVGAYTYERIINSFKTYL